MEAGRRRTRTDGAGRFALGRVPHDAGRVTVDGRVSVRLESWPGRLPAPLRLSLSERPAPTPVSERDGEPVGAVGAGSRLRLETRALGGLGDDRLLWVRDAKPGGRARLLCMERTRRGRDVSVERVYVPTSDLPKGAERGSILRSRDGRLELTDLTPREVAARRLGDALDLSRARVRRGIAPSAGGR